MSFLDIQRPQIFQSTLVALLLSSSAIAYSAEPGMDINIPAQSLGTALNELAKQTGKQLLVKPELIQDKTAPAVKGKLNSTEALDQVLKGSGLQSVIKDDAIIIQLRDPSMLLKESTLPEVTVKSSLEDAEINGYVKGYVALRTSTGTKTDTSLLIVPQTVNVVTSDQIKDQGAQSVSQALRYTPGVRVEGYGSSSPFDTYTQVRGFRSDLYLDGLRLPKGSADGLSSSVVEPWGLERIEVLKGPASGLYGQSGPGGLINMVSKRPTQESIRSVELQAGNYNRYQGAFDFSGPVDDGGKLLYRLTGLVRESKTQIDYIEDNRVYIAPSLSWKPNDKTTLTVLGNYQHDKGIWSFFNYLPAVGSLDSFNGRRISTDRFLGEPNFNKLDREQSAIGYAFEHAFNETAKFRQNVRFNKSNFLTRGVVSGRSLLNPDGTIDLLAVQINTNASTLTLDNQLALAFNTGPVAHNVVLGADYRHENIGYQFNFGAGTQLDVFDPVYGTPVAPPDTSVEHYRSGNDQKGIYVQDQAKLGRFVATLGGRYDWAESEIRNRVTAFAPSSELKQTDKKFTERIGLTYVFDSGIAPYLSYATSFQPESGVDAVTGGAFKPSTGQQYEVGIKYQPVSSKTLITIAAFDLTQQNRLTRDNLFQQRQIGEVTVRGLEIEAKSRVSDDISVIAGYAYLDHEITKSADQAEIGRKLFSTPNHQASIWGDYKTYAGLSLGSGVRYVGTTVDSSNAIRIPAVTLVDARIQYDLGAIAKTYAGLKVSVNASNLFDKEYVSQCDGETMCTYGNRRTVFGTLSYVW